jgi:hypothetical protein
MKNTISPKIGPEERLLQQAAKVACLLESRFVADVGKDRRDGILGDDSSGYHIRQNAYRLGACGRGCTPSQTIYPTRSPR